MPGSSNNSSFIPKRGTSKHTRKVHRGKVYSLTIVSYVLLFAALAASAAVYIYSETVSNERQAEIAALSEASNSFKEADMLRVQEFDIRLRQANQRLNNTVAISSIFNAIEQATIDTIRFDKFSLSREFDDIFIIEADIETDNFDSSIFQRGIYGENDTVQNIEIVDLAINEEIGAENQSLGSSVNFTAYMSVPVSKVAYEGGTPVEDISWPTFEADITEESQESEELVDEEVDNQQDI